jgi:hypothetical protein
MSVLSPLIAAMLQAGVPQSAGTDLQCRLVTPSGVVLRFDVSASEIGGPSVVLSPAIGSPWPEATVTAQRQPQLRPAAFASRAYAVGSGRDAPVVHFATPQGATATLPATIYRATRRDAVLPLAHGLCAPARPDARARPPAATAAPALTPAGVLDPARWPSDDGCRLLRPDGTAETITYFTPDARSVRLAGGPFGLRPVVGRRDIVRSGAVTLSTFSAPGGTTGIETLFVYGSWAARLLRIEPASANGQVLYGICGLTGIVRRPVRE